MNRALAKELKDAAFPMPAYRAGHKFYPPEQGGDWSDAARQNGVTITAYDLEERLQDIENGYYCPNLSDLVEACAGSFSRLSVLKALWAAESDNPPLTVWGDSPEEAVARLWLALNGFKSAASRSSVQGA